MGVTQAMQTLDAPAQISPFTTVCIPCYLLSSFNCGEDNERFPNCLQGAIALVKMYPLISPAEGSSPSDEQGN